MTLGLWAFGPFDTTFLPAAGLWTSASGVTIVAGGGRSGLTDDNCAAFATVSSSVLSRTVTPTAVAGIYKATYGAAFRVLTLTDTATLASIWTAISHFDLVATSTGVLKLLQTTNGTLLGTICETDTDAFPIGSGGFYVEVQVTFEDGLATACQINVSDQAGDMNPLVQGALLGTDAGPYTTFRLGGGVGESAATWRVTDVYLNDGVPDSTAISYRGRLIYNDSFFGNTHIDTFYPTADGTNLSSGNTPWVPNTGSSEYTQIDEHPPDEDVTYVSADESDQTSTFVYQSPRARPFGRLNCSAFAAIYAIQWDARMRTEADPGTVVPIVREIVGGTIATDDIATGAQQDVESESYLYYPDIFDRNPIDGLPWSFDVFYPTVVGGSGSTEIGMRLL